MPGTDALQA